MSESTYYIIIIVMGLMFISPAFVCAQQKQYNQVYEVKENKKEVGELFEVLFGDTSNEENYLFPKGSKLISFQLEDGELILNISEEIKNYGGTLREQWIVYKILSTGFSVPNVEKLTVLIEGKKDYLPEGTIIDSYEKGEWLEERMKSEWKELTRESAM